MNKELFWNELTEESKKMAREFLSEYNGSDGVIGRLFELYEEGASAADMEVEEYLEEVTPNNYVLYCYDRYLETKEY